MSTLINTYNIKIPSQGNVYLSTILQKTDGTKVLLVATLEKMVFSFEYQILTKEIKPTVKELYFNHIPANTELVSLDAFSLSQLVDDFLIGLTMIKDKESKNESYFHVYFDKNFESSNELNLESIAHNCQVILLDFTPFGLYHVQLPPHSIDNDYECVWLLSGGDGKIHVYRAYGAEHFLSEINVDKSFPEFCMMETVVLSLDIRYYNNFCRRISCLGCESGDIYLTIVDTVNLSVLSSIGNNFEGVICSAILFTNMMPNVPCDNFITSKSNTNWESSESSPEYNLLVTNGMGFSQVFMNILGDNWRKRCLLLESNEAESATCSLLADIDFDGNKEILIGTFSRDVIIYKYNEMAAEWCTFNRISFASPVLAIHYADLTNDGVNELIVITTETVRIHQHDVQHVLEVLDTRLKKLQKEKDTANVDRNVVELSDK